MRGQDQRQIVFRKSSLSGANNPNCVEVASIDGEAVVRDSKSPNGAWLRFTEPEWTAFIEGVRRGEFDEVI